MVRLHVKIRFEHHQQQDHVGDDDEPQTCLVDVSKGLNHILEQQLTSQLLGLGGSTSSSSSAAAAAPGNNSIVVQHLSLCLYKGGHYIGTSKINDASELQQDDVVVAKCIRTTTTTTTTTGEEDEGKTTRKKTTTAAAAATATGNNDKGNKEKKKKKKAMAATTTKTSTARTAASSTTNARTVDSTTARTTTKPTTTATTSTNGSGGRSVSPHRGRGRPRKYPKYKIGTKIYKYFGFDYDEDNGSGENDDSGGGDFDVEEGGWYQGEIVSFVGTKYVIVYEDGDSETISFDDTQIDLIVKNHVTYEANKRIISDAAAVTAATTSTNKPTKNKGRRSLSSSNCINDTGTTTTTTAAAAATNKTTKKRKMSSSSSSGGNDNNNSNKKSKQTRKAEAAPLTDEQRNELRGREVDMDQFLSFLSENGISYSNNYLTSTVKSLIEGRGISYIGWTKPFFPSSSIVDLGTNFRQIYREAINHEKLYGEDSTKGALFKRPLGKLEKFQFYMYEKIRNMNAMEVEKVPSHFDGFDV